MKTALIVSVALLASPAFADDAATKIGEQARKCWNMPSGVAGRGYSATLEVEFDKDGKVVDITAKKYPKDAVGKTFALSATRAIERCAPYTNAPVGRAMITFKESDQTKQINPFK